MTSLEAIFRKTPDLDVGELLELSRADQNASGSVWKRCIELMRDARDADAKKNPQKNDLDAKKDIFYMLGVVEGLAIAAGMPAEAKAIRERVEENSGPIRPGG